MADISRELSQEYWRQAPTPGKDFQTPGFNSQGSQAFCTVCGTPYAAGALFCHLCGLGREKDLRAEKPGLNLEWLDFDRIREQTGLSTVPLVLVLLATLFMLATVMTGLIYDTSTIAEWQAVQTWKVEWLLAAIATLLGAMLFKKP